MNKIIFLLFTSFATNNFAAAPVKKINQQAEQQVEALTKKINEAIRAIPEVDQIMKLEQQQQKLVDTLKQKSGLKGIEMAIEKASEQIKDQTHDMMIEMSVNLNNKALIQKKQQELKELHKKAGLPELEKKKETAQEQFVKQLAMDKSIQNVDKQIERLVQSARKKAKQNKQIESLRSPKTK